VPQDPFPSPGDDGEEPVPPPVPGTGLDAEGDSEQGLFVCLPAEDLDVSRFSQHGESDAMPPGPLLASVVHALAGDDGGGLAALSDDQLVGVIAATRRMESRIAWTQLAALREFAARRTAGQEQGTRREPRGESGEFAADELAGELHLTWQSAAGHIAYACAVADRLPRTFAALAAGTIHPVHARIIEDETSILSPADAGQADEELSRKAGSLTFGQLRSHAHRLVLKLDPEAARKRKEAARREAHVRRFREDSGNAGMVARELPPDEVIASWQHVDQRARDTAASRPKAGGWSSPNQASWSGAPPPGGSTPRHQRSTPSDGQQAEWVGRPRSSMRAVIATRDDPSSILDQWNQGRRPGRPWPHHG
jgi:Domain of unknown function (DUF222)